VRYAIVIEKMETGHSACAPDLSGLGVTGATIEDVRELILHGIAIYIHELQSQGEPIPKPGAIAEYADIELVA